MGVKMMRLAMLLLVACGSEPPGPIAFGTYGPLAGDAGKGSWRFGVATAATQIEDMNVATDWYKWTQPTAQGGLGKGTFVGDATMGYTKDLDDLQLVKGLGVDSYRFSIEWARIEPVKGQIDEAAIQHYRDELTTLQAMGIHPLVTIHHFSNPVWVADPADTNCTGGPTDTNLCGLGSPGGPMIVQAMADHAALLATRLGDLVDEWGTVNEPINYLLASYGIGIFPPGNVLLTNIPAFTAVLRDYISAHAAMYKAIKANDTVDADGDGVAASVGMSLSVADWEPSRFHQPSTDPDDVAARDRLVYVFHFVWVDSILNGTFDTNLDGTPDERAGVSANNPLIGDPLNIAPCFAGFDSGQCIMAPDPSYCVPRMGYEGWTDGIHDVLVDYSKRYPTLPLVVTEAGIATDTPMRRSENIVRNLEAITRARDEGVDVRGYYHWSLTDNFEWAEGFGPHFGLFSVDYSSYARSPTDGADILTQIATTRGITAQQRADFGGIGPMTPEAGFDVDPLCGKVSAP